MNKGLLSAAAGVAVWMILGVCLIYALNIGKLRPVDGAQMIRHAELCATSACLEPEQRELPFFTPMRHDVLTETQYLRVSLSSLENGESSQAFYFPKLSDNLDVRVNGVLIFENTLPRRLWNTPLLIDLPHQLRDAEKLDVAIRLYGVPEEGLDLQPFYFGSKAILSPLHATRFFFGSGLARFALGLMIFLGSALLMVWGFRRHEKEYLWLGLACFSAVPILINYGAGGSLAFYKGGTLLWLFCVSTYVLLILKFLISLLDVSWTWIERLHSSLLVLFAAVVLLAPADYTFLLSLWGNILITVPSAYMVLVILLLNRNLLSPLDFRVFFGCLSIALMLGLYAIYLLISNEPTRTMHLFHFMPLVMSTASIWLILSRLVQTLGSYEALTESLNEKVVQKTAELEVSFAELADVKKREAIAEERDRIMLDLHDGIGGQLVSTLAYMQNNQVGDEKIRRALEDALRDLALMLDSMENHDSLVTLLGMLRTRLEGLLSEHGIEFDWQVHGEPVLANPGPSQSLHLARIVQEAITNVIKHARADTITIFVDETQIRISDNGKGFDQAQQLSSEHPANGIANMKRRGEAIGADLSIQSSGAGTDVVLKLLSN